MATVAARRPDRPARRARGWLRLAAGACLAAVGMLAALAAPPDDKAAVLERRVKGALLYRFLSYVNWRDSAFPTSDAPIVIGILGSETLASELERFVQGRRVGERPIAVRRLQSASGAGRAHLLFVSRSEAGRLDDVRRAASDALIVAEWPGALAQGAVINFLIVDGYVRFEVSLESARRRGLEISSRLLAVAHNADTLIP